MLSVVISHLTSHNRFKFFFTSAARFIIMVAISVGVESLLRPFVPVCIMTTSAFGFYFFGSFVYCFISLVFAPEKQLTDALVNFKFLLIFYLLLPFTIESPIIGAFFLSFLSSAMVVYTILRSSIYF